MVRFLTSLTLVDVENKSPVFVGDVCELVCMYHLFNLHNFPRLVTTIFPQFHIYLKRGMALRTFDGGYLVKKNAFKILVGIVGRKNK